MAGQTIVRMLGEQSAGLEAMTSSGRGSRARGSLRFTRQVLCPVGSVWADLLERVIVVTSRFHMRVVQLSAQAVLSVALWETIHASRRTPTPEEMFPVRAQQNLDLRDHSRSTESPTRTPRRRLWAF